jgi:hypothetical protein
MHMNFFKVVVLSDCDVGSEFCKVAVLSEFCKVAANLELNNVARHEIKYEFELLFEHVCVLYMWEQ